MEHIDMQDLLEGQFYACMNPDISLVSADCVYHRDCRGCMVVLEANDKQVKNDTKLPNLIRGPFAEMRASEILMDARSRGVL